MGITRNKSLETFLLLSVCLAFVLVYWWERDGMYSIAVADEIAYVTCGVNLIARGEYTNAFGEPETWFPPTYPLLIGIASFGGHIDPHFTGRLVSLVFGIGGIVLIWATARRFVGGRAVPVLAGVILACNPTYQAFSFRALSEATATTMNLAAFYIWLTTYRHESKARWAIVGFLVGLSALSRPEGILLLPLWIGVDAWCKGTKRVACHALVSVIVCATSLLPYAAYLYRETGAFTITNKSEVNLADGRSAYYHTPREYIDAATLQMGYYPCDITFSQELQRYIHNVGQLGAAFLDIYAGWLSLGVLSCLAIGIVQLSQSRRHRLLLGSLAQCAYLFVVAFYVGGEKNLHAVIPVCSLLAAIGVARMAHTLSRASMVSGKQLAAGAVLALVMVVLIEGSTRTLRWYGDAHDSHLEMLREAGCQLREYSPSRGVVFEASAAIGYYSERRRGRLTPNSLAVVTEFIKATQSLKEPVFLAVSSGTSTSLHKTVRDLLSCPRPPWQPVIRLQDHRGIVAILQLRQRADSASSVQKSQHQYACQHSPASRPPAFPVAKSRL